MADPFQAALEALFASPMAIPALYIPMSGQVIATRTIRSQPSAVIETGSAEIAVQTNEFQLMRSVVAEPDDRARLVLLDEAGAPLPTGTFSLMGTPMLDAEGLTWMCEAEPA
jgi:hypothetical protein